MPSSQLGRLPHPDPVTLFPAGSCKTRALCADIFVRAPMVEGAREGQLRLELEDYESK